MHFKKEILKEKRTKTLILVSAIAALIQIILFKIEYVYPNFIPDSHIHLVAAINNQSISSLPIGYAKFLRFFSSLTSSHFVLVVFQYLFLQSCLVYFLLTIRHVLNIGNWTFRIVLAISLINPLLLYISNTVSSDALFTALSIIWFSQLLWITFRPSLRLLLFHAFILLLAFMFKYSALYYPFISILIIMFSQAKFKFASLFLIIIPLGWFIGYTQIEYKKITGKEIFLPVMGWQLAGNALYAYEYLPLDSNKNVPYKFIKLQATFMKYVDSLNPIEKYIHSRLNYYYQHDKKSPLYSYMYTRWPEDTLASPLKLWAKTSNLYKQYGLYLINKDPGAYIQYFIKPNLVYFYAPKTDFLDSYNFGSDTLESMAVSWFNLKHNKIPGYKKVSQPIVTGYFPIVSAIINILFLVSVIGFIVLKGFMKTTGKQLRIIIWALLLWICNFLFSVLAAPVVLRTQIFPMIITFSFMAVLMSYIIKEAQMPQFSLSLKKKQRTIPR